MLDSNTCDELSLRISGLISVFDLIGDIAAKHQNKNETLIDFSFFIAQELKSLFKTITGVEYTY